MRSSSTKMAGSSENTLPDLLGKPQTAAVSPAKLSPTHLRPTPIPFPGSSSTSSLTKAAASSPAPQPFNGSTPKEAKLPHPAATLRTSARKFARHTPPTISSTPPSKPPQRPLTDLCRTVAYPSSRKDTGCIAPFFAQHNILLSILEFQPALPWSA